jgi:hypothetical protein
MTNDKCELRNDWVPAASWALPLMLGWPRDDEGQNGREV